MSLKTKNYPNFTISEGFNLKNLLVSAILTLTLSGCVDTTGNSNKDKDSKSKILNNHVEKTDSNKYFEALDSSYIKKEIIENNRKIMGGEGSR